MKRADRHRPTNVATAVANITQNTVTTLLNEARKPAIYYLYESISRFTVTGISL